MREVNFVLTIASSCNNNLQRYKQQNNVNIETSKTHKIPLLFLSKIFHCTTWFLLLRRFYRIDIKIQFLHCIDRLLICGLIQYIHTAVTI